MQEQQLTAIILAATERGGMGDDYFENKTRHLLPIADKPLIQHLIETVDEVEGVGKKYTLIIEEKVEENEKRKPCEEVYKWIFRDRIGKDIELVGQDPITQVGTFEVVRRYIEEDKKEDLFPILVLYGDTLVGKNFLEFTIDQYRNEQQESKIVWGFVESKKKMDTFVITTQSEDKNNGFLRIAGKDIRNIFEHPILRRDESYDFLRDTGVIVISEDAWKDILKLIKRIHRPSSIGLFSFPNILKQALVFKDVDIEDIKDVDIEISGIVPSEDPEHPHWNEANYPWEILELNKLKIPDVVKDAKRTGEKEKSILIQEDTEWTKEKEEEIGQKTILVQDDAEFTMSNGARIKGPCILGKNTKNRDFAIHDYAIIEHSYIGDGCKIGNRTSIIDSTLVKDVRVNHDAVIEKSIIMENSVICYHAEVLHSIVGKEVMIGSGVKTPCQRLKNVEGFLFSIRTDTKLKEDLNKGVFSEVLKNAFKTYGYSVADNATITKRKENEWEISGEKMRKVFIREEDGKLNISRDKKPVYPWVTYFSDIGIKRTEKFGAIIGDYCQIGSGTVIHPGRRVGKRSKIYANCEILKNIKPSSDIRNKDMIEGYD